MKDKNNYDNFKSERSQGNNLLLMSIMTYYARQIFNGSKLYEFRKSPLRSSDLNKQIFVYSAKGDKSIIGSFKVKQIHCGNVEEIMRITGYDKRKDRYEIVKYYGNSSTCYALELYDIQKFARPLTLQKLRQIDPKVQLPQYYTYIKSSSPIYRHLLNLNNQLEDENRL